MKFISVCSGIEAASVAWNPLGWQAVAFSEIEPFPCAVLRHHYPDTPNWGDMTKYEEWPDANVDLLCGGTPCQSFSVAGLRKGLDDPRGNLMLTFGAIAAKYRPRWLVWENVPGVLSSNGGRDFGTFLGMLGQLGYGFAYRVLDAQYFGVAQRRRRAFVVGYLGDWRPAAAVLFERHSLSGDSAPSRQAGQRPAPTLSARTQGGGGLGTDFECDGGLIPDVSQCITTGTGQRYDPETETILPVAHTLLGKPNCSHAANKETYVTHSSAIVFDTTQITSAANYSRPKPGDPCHPLAAGAHAPAIAFDCKSSGQNGFGIGIEIAGTQRAMSHSASHSNGGGHQEVAYAIQAGALRENPNSGPDGVGVQSDHAYTLEARAEVQAVAYAVRTANTSANGHGVSDGLAHTLDRAPGQAVVYSPSSAPLTHTQVRRLTPEECEALQAFPRNYTRIPWRTKPADQCPDGPRYKALGNSWCVNNVRWIGERIQKVDQIMRNTK